VSKSDGLPLPDIDIRSADRMPRQSLPRLEATPIDFAARNANYRREPISDIQRRGSRDIE
jgi:hypothetical protein